MTTLPTGVACEVTDRCPTPARVRVCIAGTYAAQGPPVNSCRLHMRAPIMAYLEISSDVRVSLARKDDR